MNDFTAVRDLVLKSCLRTHDDVILRAAELAACLQKFNDRERSADDLELIELRQRNSALSVARSAYLSWNRLDIDLQEAFAKRQTADIVSPE
jgi:hypothetical protein